MLPIGTGMQRASCGKQHPRDTAEGRMNAISLRFFGSARPYLIVITLLIVPVAARGEYLLAPGDTLEVEVVGLRDFRHRVMIDLNGQASFPLIGDIKAAGLSVADLRKQVKAALSTKAFRSRALDQQGRAASPDQVVTVSPDEVILNVAEYRPI